jgi:glycosyltransferase involved in cell wall biosynthesis
MEYLVSAIVSTYNAERFIKGRLDDLLSQTLGNKLEIIVIDSGSTQNEGGIVKEYQQLHPNIKYLRTERETVYKAWNRGIELSSGKYLTNANTDDRLRKDAYEVLSCYLDEHPEYALVYPDVLITKNENETFEINSSDGMFKLNEHDREILLSGLCYIGPIPMWRKSIHEKVGFFDPDFVTSGDFEFWIKLSQFFEFKKINQSLGLYNKREDSIEHKNQEAKFIENTVIKFKYNESRFSHTSNWSLEKVKSYLAQVSYCSKLQTDGKLDECIRECDTLLEELPFESDIQYLKATSYYRKKQFPVAIKLFEHIIETNPNHSPTLNNLSVWYWSNGEKKKAVQLLKKCCELDTKNENARFNLGEMYLKIGKPDIASKWFKEVLNINRYNVEAIKALRDYYQKRDTVLSKYYEDILI